MIDEWKEREKGVDGCGGKLKGWREKKDMNERGSEDRRLRNDRIGTEEGRMIDDFLYSIGNNKSIKKNN